MTATILGIDSWKVKQTEKGHRVYTLVWKLETDDPADGPYSVGMTVGLPYPGTTWAYGNDNDPYAYCLPEMSIDPVADGPETVWKVTQTYSTEGIGRDQTTPPGNPLLEPPDVSGTFVKYVKEALKDKDGAAIKSSSHERYRGAVVERDYNRHSISIKMNLATLPLANYCQLIDNVNNATLWGLSNRKVKLSNVGWSKKYYGTSMASVYYTVNYEFDIDFETFDRYILDEGTKSLKAGGNSANPDDFVPYGGRVLLDGSGSPITNEASVYYHQKKLYTEANLASLGIPLTL